MIIAGIDPGTRESALVLVVMDGAHPHKIEKCHKPNREIQSMLEWDTYDHLIYEWIQNYGRVIGEETLSTARWCGRFELIAESRNIPYSFVTRPQVVRHFTGKNNVPKANVNQAIVDRFGGSCAKRKGGILYPISKHMWDALALAIFMLEVNDVCKPEDWSAGWNPA